MDSTTPPPPERRKNDAFRERVDEIKNEIHEEQVEGVRKITLTTSVILGVLIAIQLAIGLFVLAVNKDQSDQQNTIIAQQQAMNVQTRQIAAIVKQNELTRRQSIRDSCQEQNERHDDTLDAIDKILHDAVKDGKITKAQADGSKAQNAFLIDRLAPKRDCEARVEELTSTHPPKATPTPTPPKP